MRITRPKSRDRTTRRGLRGPSLWPGWARSFHCNALGCGGDIRLREDGRKTGAEVPLTGLSFYGQGRWDGRDPAATPNTLEGMPWDGTDSGHFKGLNFHHNWCHDAGSYKDGHAFGPAFILTIPLMERRFIIMSPGTASLLT